MDTTFAFKMLVEKFDKAAFVKALSLDLKIPTYQIDVVYVGAGSTLVEAEIIVPTMAEATSLNARIVAVADDKDSNIRQLTGDVTIDELTVSLVKPNQVVRTPVTPAPLGASSPDDANHKSMMGSLLGAGIAGCGVLLLAGVMFAAYRKFYYVPPSTTLTDDHHLSLHGQIENDDLMKSQVMKNTISSDPAQDDAALVCALYRPDVVDFSAKEAEAMRREMMAAHEMMDAHRHDAKPRNLAPHGPIPHILPELHGKLPPPPPMHGPKGHGPIPHILPELHGKMPPPPPMHGPKGHGPIPPKPRDTFPKRASKKATDFDDFDL